MDEYSSIILYTHFVKDILCDVKYIYRMRTRTPLFLPGFPKYFHNPLQCGFRFVMSPVRRASIRLFFILMALLYFY